MTGAYNFHFISYNLKHQMLLLRSLVLCHRETGQSETEVKKVSKSVTPCNRAGRPNVRQARTASCKASFTAFSASAETFLTWQSLAFMAWTDRWNEDVCCSCALMLLYLESPWTFPESFLALCGLIQLTPSHSWLAAPSSLSYSCLSSCLTLPYKYVLFEFNVFCCFCDLDHFHKK